MTEEMQVARDALTRDIASAATALAAALKGERDTGGPLHARSEAIWQEDERRARAGVRVTVNAGGVEQRRAVLLADAIKHYAGVAAGHSGHAVRMVGLLQRAVALVSQMGDALDAAEQAAADRVQADAEESDSWRRRASSMGRPGS